MDVQVLNIGCCKPGRRSKYNIPIFECKYEKFQIEPKLSGEIKKTRALFCPRKKADVGSSDDGATKKI